MSKTFSQFFTSIRIVTKRLVFMALFGTFVVGTFGLIAPAYAQSVSTSTSLTSGSASCSIATAMSVDVLSNPTPRVRDTVTYELDAAPAFTASTTLTVTDVMPAGLTFVSANPSTGSYASSTGIWNAGTLNGASNITLDITATVNDGTEGQTITIAPTINFVQSNCDQSSAAGTASISVRPAPIVTPTSTPAVADIAITKIADVTSTTEGATVHYTITASDFGPATSTGVVANDTLPSGLTFVSATTSVGSYASSTGTWTIGTLTHVRPQPLISPRS